MWKFADSSYSVRVNISTICKKNITQNNLTTESGFELTLLLAFL